MPRTASVRAVGPVTAYALDRGDFLAAVTGHHGARFAADSLIEDRLAGSGR